MRTTRFDLVGGSAREAPLRVSLSCGLAIWLLASSAVAQGSPVTDASVETAAADPAAMATPARIDALQTLASGVHPGVPLDSLLSVSLDDDSSMLERDKAVRLERRRVLIASRVGERFKNRTPEELAQMRDQLLALDLERKVLALPIEVRSRLVEVDAQGGEAPSAAAGAPGPVSAKSNAAGRPAAARAPSSSKRADLPASETTTQTGTTPARAEPSGAAGVTGPERSLFASWAIFIGLLFTVWIASRLFRRGVTALGDHVPAQRRQLASLATVGGAVIGGVGVMAAPFVAFSRAHESSITACGVLALALLVVGCRDLAASAIAGCVLALKRPLRLGDRIEVAGFAGKILNMGLTSTQLLTPQNRLVTLPNRTLLAAPVSSTHADTALAAFELDFYVDANQDAGAAKRIFGEVLANTRGADLPKGHTILIKQLLLDSGTVVRLRARIFVNPSQMELIESELTERMLDALRTGGIRAPSQLPTAPRTREPTEPFAFG